MQEGFPTSMDRKYWTFVKDLEDHGRVSPNIRFLFGLGCVVQDLGAYIVEVKPLVQNHHPHSWSIVSSICCWRCAARCCSEEVQERAQVLIVRFIGVVLYNCLV